TAFAVGLAAGLGCWAFLMFGWFLAAAAVPAALAIRRKGVPLVHVAVAGAGGLVGLLPFLWSMALSQVEVFRAASGFSHDRPLGAVLGQRLRWLGEILLSDPEMRTTLWGGPPRLPWGQVALAGGLLAAGLVVAAFRLQGGRLLVWHRSAAVCLVLLAGPLLLADWALVPHHFIALVPLAAAVLALAGFRLGAAVPRLRAEVLVAAAAYLGAALWWDGRMWRGLRDTGGIDQWSDAIYLVHDYLQAVPPGGEVAIADWGLHNNLIVLSNNRLRTREVFWGATRETSGFGRPWREEIVAGGRYLLNSGANRHFLEPDDGLRRALATSGRRYRHLLFRQRNGTPFAELYEMEPFPPGPLPPPLAGEPRITLVTR
ncbi:MAG TPA: hypothetical protein VFO85_07495, partial [Vicinamibacteria bacterium]|nr:hypothetical protein [Vicinamibacteria bacterium]